MPEGQRLLEESKGRKRGSRYRRGIVFLKGFFLFFFKYIGFFLFLEGFFEGILGVGQKFIGFLEGLLGFSGFERAFFH